MVLFRVLRAFLGRFMGFVWVCVVLVLCVACVALYACGVRRIRGLRRICPCFYPFAFLLLPFFLPLCSCFLSFFALVVFLCPFALSLWLFGCVVVSFSLSDYTQKERARRVGASSLVLLCVVC